MIGWHTPLSQEALRAVREGPITNEIIGIVVDKNFPEPDLAEQIVEGVRRFADAVWVVRETDSRARDALTAHGVDVVSAPLVPYWKLPRGKAVVAMYGYAVGDDVPMLDQRKLMRDLSIIDGCTRVVVFRDMNSATSKWWGESGHRTDHVRVVARGEKKRRYKKGRNPNV